MFCPKCGNRLPDGAAFCNACGADLAETTPPPPFAPAEGFAPPRDIAELAAQSPADEAAQPPYPAPFAYNPQTRTAPPVQARAASAQHYAAPEKPRSKKRSAVPVKPNSKQKALTALLCFLFVLFFLLSGVIGITRSMLNKEKIEQTVMDIDLDEITIEENGEDYTLAEYARSHLDAYLDERLSVRELEGVLELDSLREGLADIITGYTEYFISGKTMRTLDADAMIALLRDCEEGIYDELYYPYRPNYTTLRNTLDSRIDFSPFEKRSIEQAVSVDLQLLQLLLSPLCYGILIFLCADFLLLLFIVNRRNLCYLLPKLAVVVICLGALYLLLAAGGLSAYFFPPFRAIELLSPFIPRFNVLVAVRGGILLALGIGGKLLFSMQRKRDAKACV